MQQSARGATKQLIGYLKSDSAAWLTTLAAEGAIAGVSSNFSLQLECWSRAAPDDHQSWTALQRIRLKLPSVVVL